MSIWVWNWFPFEKGLACRRHDANLERQASFFHHSLRHAVTMIAILYTVASALIAFQGGIGCIMKPEFSV